MPGMNTGPNSNLLTVFSIGSTKNGNLNTMKEQEQLKRMYDPISSIRGVDAVVKEKLLGEGIKYAHQLLEQGETVQQRKELAQRTGIAYQTLQALVYRADLMRLRGVGSDLAYLLACAGVKNCRELQKCVAEQLYKRLAEIHIGQRIAYHAPTLTQVRSWINEAKILADASPE